MIATKKQNKYSCDAHIDMAIDDFLVENETFPWLEKATEEICSYCSNKAVYAIKFPEQK
jgi:CxxH/CxxC protein (TIGR04129 family)